MLNISRETLTVPASATTHAIALSGGGSLVWNAYAALRFSSIAVRMSSNIEEYASALIATTVHTALAIPRSLPYRLHRDE